MLGVIEVKLLENLKLLEPTKGHKVGVKGHRFLFFLTLKFIFIRSRLLGILVKRSLGQKSNFALAFELDGNAYFLSLASSMIYILVY